MAKVTTKKVATKTVAAKKTAVKKTAEPIAAPAVVETKAATKKTVVKKAAVKKVAAKKTAAKPAKALTTIVVRMDVGFGNSISLRGEGAGLSWDKGVVMGCAGPDEWVWSSDAVTEPLEFKVLVNDETWASGPNAVVAPGERIVVEPEF